MALTTLHGRQLRDATVTTAKINIDQDLSANSHKLTGVATCTADQDAANKAYVDSVASGLSIKTPVRMSTTAPLAGTYAQNTPPTVESTITASANGAFAMDNVSNIVVGNRVLVKDQANPAENGVYVVTALGDATHPWVLSRATDADNIPAGEVASGLYTFVEEGTANGTSGWVLATANPIVLGTTALTFQQFSGAGQISAGNGLSKTGNVLDVNVDGSTIEINADTLRVKDAGITTAKINDGAVTAGKIGANAVTAAKLNADTAGAGIVLNGTSNALDVNVDGSTIEISADAVRVKDAGITTAKLADDSVTAAKINADVAGNGLVQAAGGALDVNVDGTTIEITADALNVKDAGISTAKLADDSVTKAKINADVAGNGLGQNADGSLEVNVDNSTVEINADTLRVKDAGITTAKLADDSVTKAKLNADTAGNGLTQATGGELQVLADTTGGTGLAKVVNVSANGVAIKIDGTTIKEVGGVLVSDAGTPTGLAGAGLVVNGSALDVNPDGTSIEVVSDTVRVKDGGISTGKLADDAVTAAKIAADVAGNGLVQAVGGELDVNVDGATLEINTDVVRVKDLGITTAKLAAGAVTTAKITDDAVTAAKVNADVAGLGLGQDTDGSLMVNVDGTTIEITTDSINVKDAGISTAKLADDSVTKAKINADVAGNGLGQNADGSLEVKVDNTTLEITTDTLNVKDAGISTAKLADSAVTAAKIGANAVTAAKLNADTAGAGLVLNGTTNALDVNPGNGIQISTDTVAIKLATNSGLVVDANGLAVADSIVRVDKIVTSDPTLGTVGGGNTDFKLSSIPYQNTIQVFLNGVLQVETDDYTLTDTDADTFVDTCVFVSAPLSNDKVRICYYSR